MAKTKFPILASGAKEAYPKEFLAESQRFLSTLLGYKVTSEECLAIIDRMVDFILFLDKWKINRGCHKLINRGIKNDK